MIIWRGWGWLALAVGVIVGISLDEASNAWFAIPAGEHYRDTHSWLWLLDGAIAAPLCWFLGKWLENREETKAQTVIDKQTGQEMLLLGRNDLFWIPVKWWSLVWVIIAVFMVIPREKTTLIYPRSLWQSFEMRHAETGLARLAYSSDIALLVNGKVTAWEEISGDAVSQPVSMQATSPSNRPVALVIHVDDGKSTNPTFVPDGPRLVLYPVSATTASAKHPAPKPDQWRALVGQIITFRCTGADSELNAEGHMRLIRLTNCGEN
jgi:hypothetical protein